MKQVYLHAIDLVLVCLCSLSKNVDEGSSLWNFTAGTFWCSLAAKLHGNFDITCSQSICCHIEGCLQDNWFLLQKSGGLGKTEATQGFTKPQHAMVPCAAQWGWRISHSYPCLFGRWSCHSMRPGSRLGRRAKIRTSTWPGRSVAFLGPQRNRASVRFFFPDPSVVCLKIEYPPNPLRINKFIIMFLIDWARAIIGVFFHPCWILNLFFPHAPLEASSTLQSCRTWRKIAGQRAS